MPSEQGVPDEVDNPRREEIICAWWKCDKALATAAGCERVTTNATGICSPCWRNIP